MHALDCLAVSRRVSPDLPPAEILRQIAGDLDLRHAICLEMNKSADAADRPLSRYILEHDIALHRDPEEGMTDELRLSAFVLSKLGHVEDVPLLWRAKVANFDTYCGLDIQFLVSAGVRETLDHLVVSGDEQALEAAEYIQGCQLAGDFDDLQGNRAFWERYFATIEDE